MQKIHNLKLHLENMLGTKTTFQLILLSLPWYLLSAAETVPQYRAPSGLRWRSAFTELSFCSPFIYPNGVCVREMPRHVAYVLLLCLYLTLFSHKAHCHNSNFSTQSADELEVLAACWLVESHCGATCHYCSGLLTEEPHATHVNDRTYGLYVSSLFKLYFKRWRCLFGMHSNN